MARASVNNALRSGYADTANLLLDLGGETVTTGSANAYLLALPTAPTAYADNLSFVCKLHASVTAASTININGIGVKPLKKLVSGVATDLAAGNGPAGHRASCIYSSADNAVLMLNPMGTDVSDEAYDATTWNGITTVAPSKNAVRDKFESFSASESVLVIDHYPDGVTPSLDGLSHPLSGYFANLAAAQAVYPFVTALTQEVDYAAAKSACNEAFGADGAEHSTSQYLNKRVKFPPGALQFGKDTLTIKNIKSGLIEGDGKFVTQVYGKKTVLAFDGIWYTRIRDMSFTSQPAARANATAYVLGDIIKVTSANGKTRQTFICTTAGTSGGSTPVWPTDGSAIADGSAAWTETRIETLKLDRVSVDAVGVQKVYLDNLVINAGELSYCFTLGRLGVNTQGSECVYIGLDLLNSAYASYYQHGFNSLGNVFIGGDCQVFFKHGLYTDQGGFFVYGMSFEPVYVEEQYIYNDGWDIHVGTSGVGTPVVVAGCRTEGLRLFRNSGNALAEVYGVNSTPDVDAWAAGHAYSLNNLVLVSSTSPYKLMRCTTAGTSGGGEPTWPSDGTPVADGTAAWTEETWYWILNKGGRIGTNYTLVGGARVISQARAPSFNITASKEISTPGTYLVSTAAGNVTLTIYRTTTFSDDDLEDSGFYNGTEIEIRKETLDTNTVTITSSSGGIEGYGTSIVLPGGQRNSVRLKLVHNGGGSASWAVFGTSVIGFEPGSGSLVTQLTSKATGVTIDKICGRIITHNASLAATTTVSFTLTNSRMSSNDVILLSLVSGSGTAGAYDISSDSAGVGTCRINIYNRTAGALAEALHINFVIIKSQLS
jgi:hypothetical protein